MYTSFYKLDSKPFQISSDPQFLWLGEKHKEALATLKYGVLDNKGFLLLTGDVGTGKTTLINSLIESLSEDVIFASVPDPALSKLDFLNYIALEFGIDQEFASKGSFIVGFRKFLIKAHEDGKKVLLIIDESQLLTQELLEEIRLLSNIEKTHAKLINIFFVGQNEFNDSLNTPQNRAVRQRLTLNYNIDPLTPDETHEYIKYRLKVSGAEHEIFEPEAVQEIFMYSGGFPRRINIICDHALLSGYVQDNETINVNTVKECARDLKIPAYGKHRRTDGFGEYQPQYNAPEAPVHHMPQPRPVIIQPAIPQRAESSLSRNIILGVLILILLGVYLFFSGYFPQLAGTSDPKNSDFLKNQIVKVFSGGEHLEKKLPEPLGKEITSQKTIDQKKTTNVYQGIIKSPRSSSESADQKKTPADTVVKRDNVVSKTDSSPSPEIFIFPESEAGEDEILGSSKKPEPLPTEKIIVRFQYNTNEFTRQGYDALQEFADILAHHPKAKIRITGYSDSAGYKKYNERLSEFRANIVCSFFLGRGADPSQFEVLGKGSTNPVGSNDTAWGRMMNRRVEIEVLR